MPAKFHDPELMKTCYKWMNLTYNYSELTQWMLSDETQLFASGTYSLNFQNEEIGERLQQK